MQKFNIYIIVFLVTCFSQQILQAQFTIENSGTTRDLNSVYFIDSQKGFVAGENGIVMKTDNGGERWEQLYVSTSENLNGISFISPDTGFIVGDKGVFLKTYDGGLSWIQEDIPFNADFEAIKFVNSTTGFVVGHGLNDGLVCKTTDQGRSWDFQTISMDCTGKNMSEFRDCDDIYLMNVSFLDQTSGIVGGFAYNYTYGKRPFIVKTEDGGNTWRDISPEFTRSDWYMGKEIVSVNYLNRHDALAIMSTGNGTDFLLISDYKVKSFDKLKSQADFDGRGRYFYAEFLGRFIGYFTGIVDGEPCIMKTIDQGGSLMYLKPPTNKTLYASYFTDANNGYFVGEDGVIVHLKDKNNIVYNYSEYKDGYYEDIPYTMAVTKHNLTHTQIHIYNVDEKDRDQFGITLLDRYGNPVTIKRSRIRVFSDEIRIMVRTRELKQETYFYTVTYDDKGLVNGKIALGRYVHN